MPADVLALLAALLASAADGSAPVVEIHPATLVLGRGETARVVVRSPGGVPRLLASAGTPGRVREVSPGTFEAVFEPPQEAHPQLALVAALAPGGVGFAWLPLVGRGVAVARTEPHAQITVDIQGRIFGPAVADELGVARVPVEVPPGVTFARHRGKPLDLRVPPLRQVHLVVDPSELRADRAEAITVYAFAATPGGAPWAGAPVALSVSAGSLGPGRAIGPGALAAEWTLPPGPAGAVAVEARLPGVPATRLELSRHAGPPARLAVQLGAERVAAGDPPVDVRVEISDGAGNRVGGDVRLRSSFGAFSTPVREADGRVRASLRVPERLEGRAEAVVEASLGEVSERRAVALSPAAPASIEVTLDRRELTADGSSTAEVRVAIADRFGNGVDVPALGLETSRGRVVRPSREGPGLYRARYEPRWARKGGEDAVVARAGSLVATAPVRLLAPRRQLAATLRAGALHAFGGFTEPYLAGAIEAWPLRLGGAWGLSLGLGRVGTRREEGVDLGGSSHDVATSSVLWPIEASALVRRPLGPRLRAVGGAGVRAVRIHGTAAFDGERIVEWGWALGAQALGGLALDVPSWHARVSLDALLAWQDDPGMSSFRGALATFALALGVSHDAL
jgi:hypothetical protein